ncbi:MAG: hypothetical protein U0R50_00890 [Gaiellales bacterium]
MSLRAPMALALVAGSGLVAWIAGLLVYVNSFSETGRAGGGALLAASWACGVGGLLTGVLAIASRAHGWWEAHRG